MENKFKLEQKVRDKNEPNNSELIINTIFQHTKEREICYGFKALSCYRKESELELVKEKKKVTLFAPVRKSGNLLELGIPYYNNKSFFKGGDIIGWHELVVEVDE